MKGQAYALTVLLLVIFQGIPSETQCPSNIRPSSLMKQRNGACYLFQQTRKTWNKARDNCHNKGGYLAEVPDNGTQNFLLASLNSLSWTRRGVWIGATDNAVKGQWIWEGNGLPLIYTNWAPGQIAPRRSRRGLLSRPGDISSSDYGHCAQMRLPSFGRWNVYPCNNGTYSYICQFDSVNSLRSPTTTRRAVTPMTSTARATTRSRLTTRRTHRRHSTAISTPSFTSRRSLTTVRPVATSRRSSATRAALTTARYPPLTRATVPSSTKQTTRTPATTSSRSFTTRWTFARSSTTPPITSARSSTAHRKVTYSSSSLTSATVSHSLSRATSTATPLPSRKSAASVSPASRTSGPVTSSRTRTVIADYTRTGFTTRKVVVSMTANPAVVTRSRTDRAVSSPLAPASSGAARSHVTPRRWWSSLSSSSSSSTRRPLAMTTTSHGPWRTRRTFAPPPLPRPTRSSLRRDGDHSKGEKSPGAIAAIVLGSIAGVLVLAVVVYFAWSRIRSTKALYPDRDLAFENYLYAPT